MNLLAGVAGGNVGLGYRSTNRSEVRRLLPRLRQNSKILEIGCGEGRFCADVPGAGETWGIEPDVASAEAAKTRLDTVLVGVFEDMRARLPLRYFDLVVCNDVIEHMTDHDGFLRSIQAYMAPGSHLVGSVPNVRFLGNLVNLVILRDWHYQNAGILDRTHFRFFTFRSINRSLEECGFEVKRLEGLNDGQPVGYGLRTMFERLIRRLFLMLCIRDIKYLQIGFLARILSPIG